MITLPQLRPKPVSPSADQFRCDILLFVATSTEKEQLREAARRLGLSFTRIKGTFFRYYDLGQLGTYQRVLAVKTEMGPFSHEGSAARALMAITETKATAMISTGMAFGVDRKTQKHGDILVSRSLLTYDNRRVFSGFWSSRTDYTSVKPFLAKEALLNSLGKLSRQEEWRDRVTFGAMLTGGARIHCAKYRDHLVKAMSGHGEPVIGGEMEGAGLLAASNPEAPTWVIVKSICDFADKKRDDEFKVWRDKACENAAMFVLTALRDFDPEVEN
jgi:nucleoside phosphorylase